MRKMQDTPQCVAVLVIAIALMTGSGLAAAPPPVPPDLTQTSAVDRALTYNLGATGLRGWIYTKPANFFESVQGRTTTASRQILVTHVGAKSPADGVMKVDDVILGAGGKRFTDDARKSIAIAIQEAEKAANGGILKLTRWRAGKTEEVQLRLKVVGTYADTAPYNCPKSKLIFDDACKVLEKEPLENNLWGAVNGLALMAAGNPDYLPRVREFARKMGYINSAEALPVLVRLLTHEDRWLRVKAANALKNLGDTARPVVPDMLKAVAKTAEPLQPIVWDDPIQLTHGELAAALFKGLLRNSIKGIDPELLYPAIRAISKNADGMARAQLTHTFTDLLTLEDVQALAPDILAAVKTRCPADTMFGNEIRMAGFKALTKYHFKEGLEAGVLFAKTQGGHGSESRTGEIMKGIMSYGTAARQAVPGLKELIVALNDQCKRGEYPAGELNNRRVAAVEEAIKAIEAATTQPELRSISPAPPKANRGK